MEKTKEALEVELIEVLKTIYDPEIPVSIYELGLIYKITIEGTTVLIDMTLTSPNCPMTDVLMYQIDSRLKLIDGVEEVTVNLTFDPPWDKDMISEEGQLTLGLM